MIDTLLGTTTNRLLLSGLLLLVLAALGSKVSIILLIALAGVGLLSIWSVQLFGARIGVSVQRAILYIIWAALAFYGSQLVVGLALEGLKAAGVIALDSMNEAVLNTVLIGIVYALTLAIVLVMPRYLGYRTTRTELALDRRPTLSDLGLAPFTFVLYFIATAVVAYLVALVASGFNAGEKQEVGFSDLSAQYEYIVAFIALVIVAPIAEELLFRGYLFGKIKRYVPTWLTIILVSALFGAAHGQWNVAIDTFVLSVFLCLLRVVTGSLWPSIVLHMIKNGIAYYFLFANPFLLNSLGG